MIYKFKVKFKNKNEIIALILLLSITVILTSYYNYTKLKINNSYKDVINNIYFKKTANHFLNNLEPKFKKINHKISPGETFNTILKNYSVDNKEIEIIKQKLSEKINLNKLNTNQKIFLIIDQSNNSIKEFVFQVSNKERVILTRNIKNNQFQKEVLLLKLNKDIIYKENGVGSGAILLSILKEKKGFFGTGIDISNKCINVSKKNAYKLEVYERVKLFKSNIDNFKNGKYDLIISNPPYIKNLDLKKLDKDVKDFEPRLALNGGLDGLSEIRKIIKRSTELIKKNGKLIIEIAFDQKNEVKKILKDNGFYIITVIKDLAKNDRCIISKKI